MNKIMKPRTASEVLDVLEKRSPKSVRIQDEVSQQIDIAQIIYDARTSADLSQAKLARMVGTTQSVVSRLEDANYAGHSLFMIHRVAAGLGKKVDIRLVAQTSARRRPVVEKKRQAS